MAEASDWQQYYSAAAGRAPRPHLIAALEHVTRVGTAIDLGAGDGVDSRFLLDRGWKVVSVDAIPGLRERIAARADASPRLDARDTSFGDLAELPDADLILASYSLPFARATEFAHIWTLITAALCPGGVFAGQLFGHRDDWAAHDDVLTHSASEVADLLAQWQIVELSERERDGPSGRGPKHWHVFDIISRRL
ncbi:class I SAM-dependent methyltransferase [Microbacterium sp. KSW-18]|uniref:Class I SAM-dependent methyltransferase n=1 Tax=Microbacterium aquilitoris TaxID=3067307 RepID=A0ABU3GF97_9MICO|nr:class I SAM-dependent methyltransferase [Microbacterium sp. KSW-18]MDT3329368.1 class I SAM-dependent methyltransferase [Microbacterium sp. KSW-18]